MNRRWLVPSFRFALAALCLLQGPFARIAPAAPPASAPAATAPATLPDRAQRQRLMQLTRKALDQLQRKQYEPAQRTLDEAIAIDPGHSINLYNMACLQALTGHADRAADFLERSVLAGFSDFIHIERDTDLDTLRKDPRYVALMARRDEFQRKAADRVLAWLKSQFGEGYLYDIDDKSKLIFATNTDKQTLATLKSRLVMQANAQWAQVFEHKPDQYISVVLPSPADFREIMSTKPGVGGFYNHDNRILIAGRLGQVMQHEFTHALHAADLDPLGQDSPIWFAEGIATLYEPATFQGDKLVPAENSRLVALQAAARGNRLIPLDRLFKMEQKTFIAQATLAYGQSGSVLHYLYQQGQLRKFYDAMKATYDRDKTGRAALESITGKPLADFEKDWRAWMVRQTPPPTTTGPDGAFVGAHFEQGPDGVRVDTVVANAPGARAGLKPEDVVVAVDDQDVRDYNTLMVVLAARQPGEQITLKVRRGDGYQDLPLTLARRSAPSATAPARRPASRVP